MSSRRRELHQHLALSLVYPSLHSSCPSIQPHTKAETLLLPPPCLRSSEPSFFSSAPLFPFSFSFYFIFLFLPHLFLPSLFSLPSSNPSTRPSFLILFLLLLLLFLRHLLFLPCSSVFTSFTSFSCSSSIFYSSSFLSPFTFSFYSFSFHSSLLFFFHLSSSSSSCSCMFCSSPLSVGAAGQMFPSSPLFPL